MVSGASYQHDGGTSSTANSSPDWGKMKVANGGIPSILPPGGPYLAEVLNPISSGFLTFILQANLARTGFLCFVLLCSALFCSALFFLFFFF
jgi:hypothetical protein